MQFRLISYSFLLLGLLACFLQSYTCIICLLPLSRSMISRLHGLNTPYYLDQAVARLTSASFATSSRLLSSSLSRDRRCAYSISLRSVSSPLIGATSLSSHTYATMASSRGSSSEDVSAERERKHPSGPPKKGETWFPLSYKEGFSQWVSFGRLCLPT